MMKYLILVLVGVALGLAVDTVRGDPAPIRPGQPHQDIFESVNGTELQQFNPLTDQVKEQREARYRLVTLPSCVSGTIPADLVRVTADLQENVQFSLIRNDTNFDFTIRINCGTDHLRICGSLNVFCLGRGFPFVVDTDISDVLSNWQPDTRLSILEHEVMHALLTWMEQYCLGQARGNYAVGHPCRNLPRFTPTPLWADIMNTGPLSRHGFTSVEIERWERTGYELQEPAQPSPWFCPGSWQCHHETKGWVAPDGAVFNLETNEWELHPNAR